MAKKKKTLAKKISVSSKKLSRKIAKVTRDSPGLTRKQIAGKAAGILEGDKKRRKK